MNNTLKLVILDWIVNNPDFSQLSEDTRLVFISNIIKDKNTYNAIAELPDFKQYLKNNWITTD